MAVGFGGLSLAKNSNDSIDVTCWCCFPCSLPAEDQHYCNHALDHILRKTPTYKRRWLHQVRQAIDQKTGDLNRQHPITNYFKRASTQQPKHNNDTSNEKIMPQPLPKTLHRRPIQATYSLLTAFLRECAPNITTAQTLFPTSPAFATLLAEAGYLRPPCPKLNNSIKNPYNMFWFCFAGVAVVVLSSVYWSSVLSFCQCRRCQNGVFD